MSCHENRSVAASPPITVTTTQLNPVLAKLPPETARLGERVQLCVPVAKNGGAADFPLKLTHLNPVLARLPAGGMRPLS